MRISKSAVFLFELMVIILVFTMAAAICSLIFADAFKMSTESHDLTMSSINAQAVAEHFKAGDEGAGPLYFDRDWKACGASGAYYTVALEEQEGAPDMREAYVHVYKKDGEESIFTLHVKEFVG
jgi:hypothetical protein